MKRVGRLLARSLVGALLLLALTANVASADPGKGHGHAQAGALLAQPEDPGLGDGGGYEGDSQPEDPGVAP